MDYADELAVAKQAARNAGDTMEQYRQDGFDVSRKSAYNDLVTEADTACQEQIIETITAEFPDDGFLAEENDRRPANQNRVWVIDPIDGTRNFAHGMPSYCTSIALKDGDDVVVGAVYAPRTDELFTAVRGEGAWLNGEQIAVSDRTEIRGALVAARMSDYTASIRDMEAAILDDLLEREASFRRIGSAALDLCHVAAGRLDAHILVTINEWDVASGGLIVEEAGGAFRCTDAVVDGLLETIASNGHLHDDVTTIVDQHTRKNKIVE